MPISKTAQSLYPPDWCHISHVVKDRAGWRCENPTCGAAHGAWGWWDGPKGKQVFRPLDRVALRAAGYRKTPFAYPIPGGALVKVTEIVITCAHKDHDPTNNADENLVAWCARCHLAYDLPHHMRNAAETRRRKMATRDLLDLTLQTVGNEGRGVA